MSQIQVSKKLTKLEWFGLISGLIGLLADVITLSALLKSHPANQSSNAAIIQVTSFPTWLILFFGISYTVLIASFYTRRVLINKHKQKRKILSYEKEKSIERGIMAITLLIGIPLFILHFILLFYIISENIGSIDSQHLRQLMGETDTTSAIHSIGARWVVLAPALAVIISMILNLTASTVYSALNKDD